MKKLLFMAMLLGLTHASFSNSNTDSIPQQKWITYLDSSLCIVTDTSSPIYSRYTYFVNGVEIYPKMRHYIGKNYKLEINSQDSIRNNKLNGVYTWFDDKGKISSQHTFENGNYISIQEFDKKGRLRQKFDFTVKKNNDPVSYCVYQYNKKSNKIKTYYFHKDKNGNWPRMR